MITLIKVVFTAVKGFFAKLPKVVWIAILCAAVLFFVDRRARSIQKGIDAAEYKARIDSMIAHPDTTWVPIPVTLPPQTDDSPIFGAPLPLSPEVERELTELRQAKISDEAKIKVYEILLRQRTTAWESTYQDSVQVLVMESNPVYRTTRPKITYKTPQCMVPVITNTVREGSPPWWRSSEAKVVYGIVGAGFVYSAIENNNNDRLWRCMAGVSTLTLSFGL